jgi:hypothetical protein
MREPAMPPAQSRASQQVKEIKMAETQTAFNEGGKAKKKTQVTKVKMEDGREVEFAGERKVLKDGIIVMNDGAVVSFDDATEDQRRHGQPAIRFDFVNGTTRAFPLRKDMLLNYAIHGGKQKYGDELAGHKSDDPDDWALTLDELHEQLHDKGDWYAERAPGMAGTSILIKALMEFNEQKGTPKSVESIKAFLKDKKPAEKEALKHTDRLRPIVARLEEERRARAGRVDTDALLSELDAA